MQTVTDTFVSDVINILSQNRESRNMSNYSGLLNVEFFTTFEAIQTKFFKNLANYLSMFLFFHDQIAMPTFFPIYDVVDSNLDFTTFVLSDKDDLLKTNVRNMRTVDFRKYKRTFVALKNAFSLSSIANDSLISSSFIQQVDTFGVVVDKLKAFLRFSGEIVDRLDEYIIELDTYYSIIRDDENTSTIHYTQKKLETKLRAIISNISSSDVVSSISIVEGGEDFQVGDVLTIESPDTNEVSSILEVTGIINGHIREVGISFSGEGFAVDDVILDSAGGTTFDMIVNAIQNGFVSSASVQDGGSGFAVGDNLTQQSSTGDGTGMEISVTDVSGELADSPTLNFTNTGDYSLTYNGKPTDFTTTKDSVTIQGSVSNATVEITSINPESLSGFQMSQNHLLNHNSTPTFDIDQPTINFSYAGTTFDAEIDQFHYRKDQFQIVNNTKSDSEINDVFHIHSDNRRNLSFKVQNIFCDSNTVELEIDSTNTNKFEVLESFSPTIDSVHSISTQITQVDIDSNAINLTSDAPNYDVSYIGNSYPGLVYGSDTNNPITADITSVSFDSNAIQLEVADSNDSNFAMTDSFDDITYGNSVETISIQPTSVQIAQDTLSSVIQIDTNNSDYEAQQSFSMTYGSDTNNPITVNIDEIEIPENSIQVSTADDSNLLLDQYTVHYSDTNVDIVLTPSQYKISSNLIPIIFDSNDTNFEIDQSLNFSFTNNTITTTVDQITVDPAYIETNFSFNDTNNEAYTVNQSFDISLDGNALNPSVTSIQITENSIDANEIAFTSDSNETVGESFDLSYGVTDTNDTNVTVTVDEVSIAQDTIDSSNIGFTSDSNESLGQTFTMSYGVTDTNQSNVTATVTELSIPENSIALSYDSNNFVFDSNVSLTQNDSLSIIDTNAIVNFDSTNHFLEVSDDQQHGIYVTRNTDDDGYIYVYNSGTWTLALTVDSDIGFYSVSISSSGQYMYFTVQDSSYLGTRSYKSSNYGSSFSFISPLEDTTGPILIDFSDDAQYGLAGHTNADDNHWSGLRLTTNSGLSWSDVFLSNIVNDTNVAYLNVISVSVSSTGQYMSVLTGGGGSGDTSYKNRIYTSSDYGSTWTKHDIAKNWKEIKISSDGKYQTAITSNDKIYVSGNFGGSFSERNLSKNWKSLAMTSSGEIQVASSTSGTYVSYDSGLTWQLLSASEVYDDVSFSSTNLQAIQSSGGDAYETSNSETSNSETYNLSYGLVDTNSNNITVTVSKDHGIVTVSLTNDSITAVNNILTDSSGYFSLASTPSGTATVVSFTNHSITAVNDTLTESTGKFSLVSSPTGSASSISFTNGAITAITDILTDASGKFSLTTSPVGVVLSVAFAPVSPIQLSDSTLPVTGADAAKFDFTQETPKGYASSISNSHSDIIYNATDSTDFGLISSRDPVELSASSQLGYTVRLSPDGNTLGVCDKVNNNGFGKVVVYRWDGTTWNELDTILQQNHNDMQQTHFGGNIEFSSNGNIMAVAATGPGDRTGMVYVYTLDETDSNNVHYTQRGSTLHDIYETDVNSISYNNGTNNSQNRNRRIGFSSDAQYLAIGSPYYDDHTQGLVSNVTIYKWNTANSDWEVHQVLNSSDLHKRFGFGLALSQDGQKLVIMEEDELHYYQKESGSFVEKWSIDSTDYSDFSNMVGNISSIQDDCKNLIRFTPDGSKFFVGFPSKKESVYFQFCRGL